LGRSNGAPSRTARAWGTPVRGWAVGRTGTKPDCSWGSSAARSRYDPLSDKAWLVPSGADARERPITAVSQSRKSTWSAACGAALASSFVICVVMARRVRRLERSAGELRHQLEQLVSAAPHALRGPLTPIVARAQLLRTCVSERSGELLQVEAILRSAERLSRMIDDLANGQLPEAADSDSR
jgi:signal transduction histidine kinase